jgi:hypothetical protein
VKRPPRIAFVFFKQLIGKMRHASADFGDAFAAR